VFSKVDLSSYKKFIKPKGRYMTKIKICGITKVEEAKLLIDYKVDYAGMILFYPKSKRNISIEHAKLLLQEFKNMKIQTVAVTVLPSILEMSLIQEAGFDLIQVYGDLKEEDLKGIRIPIMKSFHVAEIEHYKQYDKRDKICGFVFDGSNPGSGIAFDWSKLKEIHRSEKLFVLAGGLNKDNVAEAIQQVNPDVVDVSSGVEGINGKEEELIRAFVEAVRN
jgi:phosphoribosylanthranilate isomerase